MISFWALVCSQPPNMRRWGPMAVEVWPKRDVGGLPMYLPRFHDMESVLQIMK